MKTNSINRNGCSVCEQGQENYTTFIAETFRGTEYFQYDYRNTDGELFSTVAKSLEECQNGGIFGLRKSRKEPTRAANNRPLLFP